MRDGFEGQSCIFAGSASSSATHRQIGRKSNQKLLSLPITANHLVKNYDLKVSVVVVVLCKYHTPPSGDSYSMEDERLNDVRPTTDLTVYRGGKL